MIKPEVWWFCGIHTTVWCFCFQFILIFRICTVRYIRLAISSAFERT